MDIIIIIKRKLTKHRLVGVKVVPVVHLRDGLGAGQEHAAVDHRTDAVDERQEAALAGGAGDAELQFGVRVKDALVVELELDEGLVGDDGLQDRGLHVYGLVCADRPNLDEVGDSSAGSSSWRCVSHYIQF